MIKTKCVYDKKYPEDGAWILVMRKWPRGIPKTKIDEWHKDLGPSNELLSDWNKKKISWGQYEKRYLKELEWQEGLLRKIAVKATKKEMTLLCVEKNDKNCHRRILRNTLVNLAVIEFKKMLKVSSKNIELYDFYGYFLVHLDKRDEAKRVFRKAVRLTPISATEWCCRAKMLTYLERDEEALENYDKAIEMEPRHVEAWINRGLLLMTPGKHVKALDNFTKLIRFAPNCVKAWFYRAVVCERLGKYKKAIKDYDKTLKLKPESTIARNKKGVALTTSGQYAEALTTFRKLVKIEPDNVNAIMNEGNVLSKMGRLKQALKSLNKAISLKLNYAYAYLNRGCVWAEMGNQKKALSDYSKAIKIMPNYALAWINRGGLYFYQRRYKDAMVNMREAIKIASKQKNLYQWSIAAATYFQSFGIEMLSKGFLKNARNYFLKSANISQKYHYNKGSADILFVLAGLVQNDLAFREYLNEDLELLKLGIEKTLFELRKITIEKGYSIAQDIVGSKQIYFLILSKALDFRKVDLSLFRDLEKILKKLNFVKYKKTVKECKNIVIKLDNWGRKQEIKSIDDIPMEEQAKLKKIIIKATSGISKNLTYQGAEKLSQDRLDILLQEMRGIRENQSKVLTEHKEIKKGIKGLKAVSKIENGKTKIEKMLEYEIWTPNNDEEGCIFDKLREGQLKTKFKSLKDKHKLLIDYRFRSIYVNGDKIKKVKITRKDKKTGRKKYDNIKIGPVKYNLLIYFLKHKDEIVNDERGYLIGWAHLKPQGISINHKDSLKTEISVLNAIFKALRLSLKIEPDRLIGYRCEGNSDFCLVLKNKRFSSGCISSEQAPENHTSPKGDLALS